MIIEQILVTGMAVFCYLVVDETTKEAVLIDPAGDFDSIYSQVDKHHATVKYVINTHGHYDHTSGNDHVMKRSGAQLLIHKNDIRYIRGFDKYDTVEFSSGSDKSGASILILKHNDEIRIGNTSLRVIHTPGHTTGCISLYGNDNIFTGDTLFTEGVGRTDLPDSSERDLADSIKNKILTLPDNTRIWPGHHYGRKPSSTVAEQKKYYGL